MAQFGSERANRFRVDGEIARGGMGVVYRAFDRFTQTPVALKRLRSQVTPQTSGLFEREFHVVWSLKHPSIIQAYDYGVDDEGPYYTMELLDGSDLREIAPLDVPATCRYLRDVASALALLHARRLLHRDVSPSNVRVLPGGGCKLIDFGALTSFGIADSIVGTPPAIPPEALAGQPLDQRADLYSLGALAYWLLTGRHAYRARRVCELPEAWRVSPIPPSKHNDKVSPELERLVLSLLSPDVLARPANATLVIDRLNVIGGLPTEQDTRARAAYLAGFRLVERNRELDWAGRRIQRAASGSGQAIFIHGAAGVGKTRLLAEVTMHARMAGMTVLSVDAAAHPEPFSAVRTLMRQLGQLLPGAVATAEFRALASVWPEVDEDREPASEPSSSPPSSVPATLSGKVEKCLLEATFVRPLVLAVDNVHEADPKSSALLLALARSARARRLLIATTATGDAISDRSPGTRALRDLSAGIRLRDLSEPAVESITRACFGEVPHVRRTARWLYDATEGNPERCMRLLQHWVETGVVGYADGTWVLPLDLAESALPPGPPVVVHGLPHCSPEAIRLAHALSLLECPASTALCAALASSRDRRAAIAIIEELVTADILVATTTGYRFRQATVAAALRHEIPDEHRVDLHTRLAEALSSCATDEEQRAAAGLHWIRSGQTSRGVAIVRGAARSVLEMDGDPSLRLARMAPALEAALEVQRVSGGTNLKLLVLLVPLVVGSREISYEFAMRYGAEAVERLQRALGLSSTESGRNLDAPALVAALQSAPHREPTEVELIDAPDVSTLVGWLIKCTITLVSVGSIVLDHEANTRTASALFPFTLLGNDHPGSVAYEYCQLVIRMSEDRLGDCHEGWCALLERLDHLPLSPWLSHRLRIGAIYSLGVLEAQLDDGRALDRIATIETLPTEHRTAIANQLRFLYHGFRGEAAIAEQYRARVEAYAIERGSAWQVETWSTCTLCAVCSRTGDAISNKRVAEQLERLQRRAPSLTLYWKRAVALQWILTKNYARAVEDYEELLSSSTPRDRVGWSCVRGSLANAYNHLGNHERAKRICEETIELGDDDRDFVAVNLDRYLQLARARAGLGDAEGARVLLGELFERYRSSDNPMTLGALHRTAAQVALVDGDEPGFERHLTEMARWFRATQNPALIIQCEELRHSMSQRETTSWEEARSVTWLATMAGAVPQSVFAECRGTEERKQRALELIAKEAGASEAWLFEVDQTSEAVLVGRLGIGGAPAELVDQVKLLFADYLEDTDETTFVFEKDEPPALDGGLPEQPFRVFPLSVGDGAGPALVGAVAVRSARIHASVSVGLLTEVATQLYQAGDIGESYRAEGSRRAR